ncbi:hypothetical protein BKA70DRAFT_1131763, partial [Coprinopsis sp. MPI-PUGE-AT-0042]
LIELEARVNVQRLVDEKEGDLKAVSDALSELVWSETRYRYVCVPALYPRTKGTHLPLYLTYHCSQLRNRQKKPRKSKVEGVKHRDKLQMITFACDGWLIITLSPSSNVASVRLKHCDDHIPYWRVDIPEETQQFIRKNCHRSLEDIWGDIIQESPIPSFTRRAVSHLWHEINSQKWKRDSDELKSAKILIEEASDPSKVDDPRFRVTPVKLPELEGFKAIAFVLPHFMKTYGDSMRELSLDSTWKTNGNNYECYAILGEVQGSGCPLGYLLVLSSSGEAGGKEKYIACLLNHIKKFWNLSPIVTLTDKDWSEINACRKQRLTLLRRRPKFYNVEEACKEFNFIDESFVPIAQVDEDDRENIVRSNLSLLTDS